MPRSTATDLAVIRRAYAAHILAEAGVRSAPLERSFAAVPREAFLGRGPWQILRWGRGYAPMPSADPLHLYANLLVAIRPQDKLNNGEPSFHATLMAALAALPGQHVLHIGAGTGYFTAVLAEQVGRRGRFTAFEVDAELAARARRNLRPWPQVCIIHGDALAVPFDPADGIYVNAGATHPPAAWLDGLKPGGRLILPLTTSEGWRRFDAAKIARRGAVFLIARDRAGYRARWLSPVAIYPCAGARDAAADAALRCAFKRGGWERVRRLHRGDEVPKERCWVRGNGWGLVLG
jgi:protein-L-isoaspartate(D-aspartate) O-methyltransferase